MKLTRLTDWRPDDEIQKAIDKTIDEAEKQFSEDFTGEYPPSGIGISTLRPEHVQTPEAGSLNVWKIAIAAATTWQDWWNITMDEDTFVIICGIFNRTVNPGITELAWQATGKDLPVQNIEPMYVFPEPRCWLGVPFSIKPKKKFVSRLYGEIVQTERFGAMGFTIARRDILITES